MLCFMSESNKKLSPSEAAEIAGVSYTTILNHINRGNLPATKRLHEWQILRSDLYDWMESQGL